MDLSIRKGETTKTLARVLLLLVLLGILASILQHQYGETGTSVLDRLRAKPVVTDFDVFSPKTTVSDIQQSFHTLHFTCHADNSPLGASLCWAPISKFNGVDAKQIAFFFRDEKLNAVRISFSSKNHPALFSLMNRRYGPTLMFGKNRDLYGNNIVGWIRPSGIVAVNDHIAGDNEAILLWVSGAEVLRKVFGGSLPSGAELKAKGTSGRSVGI